MRLNRRAGFTLMELLMVMALIIIAAAVGIPVWQTMLADARQTSAGDMIRARMAETRARAMESGRPWRVACIPNTPVFQIAPDDSTVWEQMERTPKHEAELKRDELPKDIVFAINPGDIAGSPQPGTPGTEWHTLAVYQFDGSAREDSITYFGKMSLMPMGAELRGLTGSVTMKSAAEVKASLP